MIKFNRCFNQKKKEHIFHIFFLLCLVMLGEFKIIKHQLALKKQTSEFCVTLLHVSNVPAPVLFVNVHHLVTVSSVGTVCKGKQPPSSDQLVHAQCTIPRRLQQRLVFPHNALVNKSALCNCCIQFLQRCRFVKATNLSSRHKYHPQKTRSNKHVHLNNVYITTQ